MNTNVLTHICDCITISKHAAFRATTLAPGNERNVEHVVQQAVVMPKAVRTYTSPGLLGSSVDARPEQAQSIGGITHPNGRLNGSGIRSEDAPILTPVAQAPQERYPFSEEDDSILRSCYGTTRRSKHDAIALIQKRHPTYPKHVILRRARRLGLAMQRKAAQPWTAAEIKRLKEMRNWDLDAIVAEIGRSPDSVRSQLRRQNLSADFLAGFKTQDLVKNFRATEDQVEQWIRRGWAKREHGRVTEESIRELFREHPEQIPFQLLAERWRGFLMPDELQSSAAST